MTSVIKRDGRNVPFDEGKIEIAVSKAMAENQKGIEEDVAALVAKAAKDNFTDKESVTIEEIQDFVELELMKHSPEAAKNIFFTGKNAPSSVKRAGKCPTCKRISTTTNTVTTAKALKSLSEEFPAATILSARPSRTKSLCQLAEFLPAVA